MLIEATCNQVNHLGGYTGMTPEDFAGLVLGLVLQPDVPVWLQPYLPIAVIAALVTAAAAVLVHLAAVWAGD